MNSPLEALTCGFLVQPIIFPVSADWHHGQLGECDRVGAPGDVRDLAVADRFRLIFGRWTAGTPELA